MDLGTNSITGLPNKSIHPNPRKFAAAERRKRNWEKNKAFRSSLYAEHTGSNGWQKDVSTWHSALFALSNGSAG
jgi:hypothetical protein